DEQGVLVKWYGTAIDVHATRTTEERAKHLAAELASTLESITDVFFTLDRDLRIVYVNSEGARLTERDAGALQGVHLTEAFPPSISKAIVQAISLAPDPAMPVPLEIRHELRDAWYFGRAYPSPTGHAVYLRDETQTRRAREALRESEERFRLLARASHDAIRDWDLQSNGLWWNDGFEALFGYALHAGGKTIDAWAERIHPEDYPRVTSGIKEALQLGKQQWSSEYRFERV